MNFDTYGLIIFVGILVLFLMVYLDGDGDGHA